MPSFGEELKTNEDYLAEIYSLVSKNFPMSLRVVDGELIYFSYETEWQEGHVETIESLDADGITVFDNIQNYQDKSLTKEEQNIIDAWAADNIKTN